MNRKLLLVTTLILMSVAFIFANGDGEEEAMAIEVMDGYKSADVEEAGVNVQWMIDGDAEIMSHHLWRYLNLNLTGDAKLIHSNTDGSNGLEIWRDDASR